MKKLMTACAACVLAGMVSAQVESVNIVGYVTRELDNETGLIDATSPFKNMATVDGSFTVTDGNFLGQQLVDGDLILLLNMEYLAFDTFVFNSTLGWLLTPGEGEDFDIPVESFTVYKGDTFYAVFAANKVVTAGEVAASGKQYVEFNQNDPLYPSGIFPFANAFPVETTFGDIGDLEEGDIVLTLNMEYLAFDTYVYNTTLGWLLTPGEGEDFDIPVQDTTICMKAGGAAYFVPAFDGENPIRQVSFTLNY